jgi:hypothetical protein
VTQQQGDAFPNDDPFPKPNSTQNNKDFSPPVQPKETQGRTDLFPRGSSVRAPLPSADGADLPNFTPAVRAAVAQEFTAQVTSLEQELEFLAEANAVENKALK